MFVVYFLILDMYLIYYEFLDILDSRSQYSPPMAPLQVALSISIIATILIKRFFSLYSKEYLIVGIIVFLKYFLFPQMKAPEFLPLVLLLCLIDPSIPQKQKFRQLKLYVLGFYLCWTYGLNLYSKLHTPSWISGENLYRTLQGAFATDLSIFFYSNVVLIFFWKLISIGVLLTYFVYIVMMIFRKLIAAQVIMILSHLSFLVVLNLRQVSFGMLLVHIYLLLISLRSNDISVEKLNNFVIKKFPIHPKNIN